MDKDYSPVKEALKQHVNKFYKDIKDRRTNVCRMSECFEYKVEYWLKHNIKDKKFREDVRRLIMHRYLYY